VADEVRGLVPGADIAYTGEVGADPRDYRVNFDLLGRLLPDFRLAYTLRTGMDELHEAYRRHRFTADDFRGPQFVRLRTLSGRMHLLAPAQAA
jgi:hypothetical protein